MCARLNQSGLSRTLAGREACLLELTSASVAGPRPTTASAPVHLHRRALELFRPRPSQPDGGGVCMLRCTLSGRRCEWLPPSPPAPSMLSACFAAGTPCAQHRMNDVRPYDARCFESWVQSIMWSPEVSRRPAVLQVPARDHYMHAWRACAPAHHPPPLCRRPRAG